MSDGLKIIRCARCTEIFVRIRTAICPNCIEDEEDDYRVIRDILHEYTKINVARVAELAEVTEACVLRMLEQGLIVNEQVNNDVKCGNPAISNLQRLCAKCLSNLDQKFYSEINEAKQRVMDEKSSDSVHVMLNRKRDDKQNKKINIKEF